MGAVEFRTLGYPIEPVSLSIRRVFTDPNRDVLSETKWSRQHPGWKRDVPCQGLALVLQYR
jgi:hypothetical protein